MSTTDTLEGVDVAALFASIDRFDSEAFSAFFAEDATYVFANHPPIQGRDAIVAAAAEFWVTLEGSSTSSSRSSRFPEASSASSRSRSPSPPGAPSSCPWP